MPKQELVEIALALPTRDRLELAQALWQSIESLPTREIFEEERRTAALAAARDRDLETGAVAGHSHEEVMKAARRALR